MGGTMTGVEVAAGGEVAIGGGDFVPPHAVRITARRIIGNRPGFMVDLLPTATFS